MDRVENLPNIESTLTNNDLFNCSRASYTMRSNSLVQGRRRQGVADPRVEVLVDARFMYHALYLVSSTGYHALYEDLVRKKQRVNEQCGLLRGQFDRTDWHAPVHLACCGSRVSCPAKLEHGSVGT